jgi:hypothetical protein
MRGDLGKLVAMAFSFALGLGAPASAQMFTGRIDVTVEDPTGGRLPGVAVNLTGPVNQSQATDAIGQAHFLNLTVGTYAVTAALSGFETYTNPEVVVTVGASTGLGIKLGIAGQVANVSVTAALPIVDTTRQTTTTNVTYDELQNIPSARDPWVLMQTVPSISVDRVNVGGSQSGQQSVFLGKGSSVNDNAFAIDGVQVTDMSAMSSAFYYDFDTFQEVSVTTGGADVRTMAPGVQLNLVLKGGTNVYHGDARVYFENTSLQANNLSPALATTLGSATGLGNRINQYTDDGFDLGGPIVKDKLFAWGTISRTNIQNLNLQNVPDQTTFRNYAFKADYTPRSGTRLNFTFIENNKIKVGRNVPDDWCIVFGCTAIPESTNDQNGPSRYYKGEANFTLCRRFFAVARYAYTQAGFALVPEGGLTQNIYLDQAVVQHGSNINFSSDRPQYNAGADASYFAGKHEVKFGFSWRRTPVSSTTTFPGNHIVTVEMVPSDGGAGYGGYPNLSPTYQGTPCGGCNSLAYVLRDFSVGTVGQYASLFGTDTISLKRLTITAGLRYDHQTSSLAAASVAGVAGFTSVLPAATATPVSNVYAFNTVNPRVGMTYALDESSKTVARASYALFASQLPAAAANFVSPAASAYVVYYAASQDPTAAPGKIFTNLPPQNFTGPVVLPGNTVSSGATNGNTVTMSDPLTHEIQLGIDHEVMPNLGVGATFTWRRNTNLPWALPMGVTSASYQQVGTLTGTLPTGGSYSVPYYATHANWNGLWEQQNRPDYYQQYLGFDLTATKRLADRWMARVGVGTSSFREYFSNLSTSLLDPTPTVYQNVSALQWGAAPAPYMSGPAMNGGSLVLHDTASGEGNVYIIPLRYQFSGNGMYQGPWGINFAASLFLRQGYAQPFYRNQGTGDVVQPSKRVLVVSNVDDGTLQAVKTLDARIEKMQTFGRFKVAFDFDVFNLFNSATVLADQYVVTSTLAGQPQEIMNPRIARLGLRFLF